MGFLKWSNKYAVNMIEIDEQHKKLINLINQMYDAMHIGKGKDIVGAVIADLVNYTVYHFDTEELLLQQYDYPHYKEHKELHDTLSKKARNLQETFDHGKRPTTIDVMLLLTNWLNAHILVEDKKYEPYLRSKINR